MEDIAGRGNVDTQYSETIEIYEDGIFVGLLTVGVWVSLTPPINFGTLIYLLGSLAQP